MNFALSDIIDSMDTNDYHTISETGSNAITMRKAKPSVGLRWNAIRAALRWPLRIIGIIMFIMSAYVFFDFLPTAEAGDSVSHDTGFLLTP